VVDCDGAIRCIVSRHHLELRNQDRDTEIRLWTGRDESDAELDGRGLMVRSSALATLILEFEPEGLGLGLSSTLAGDFRLVFEKYKSEKPTPPPTANRHNL
jgi:hypothetical protein